MLVLRCSKFYRCLIITSLALFDANGAAADEATKFTLDKHDSVASSQLSDPVTFDQTINPLTAAIATGAIASSSHNLPGSIPCTCTVLASRIKVPLPPGAQVQNPSQLATTPQGDDTVYQLTDQSGCSGVGPFCNLVGCSGTLTYKNGTQTVSDTYQGTCRAIQF